MAELVPDGSRVADIGTHDGRLAAWLLESGRATWCVASERLEPSLEKIRAAHPAAVRAGSLILRHGDGLEVLVPGDGVDTVVLAGLGFRTMARILASPAHRTLAIRRLVLQPQTEPAAMRGWLWEHGWSIVDERLALESDRYYEVIAAEPGADSPSGGHSGLEQEAGPVLLRSRNPLLAGLWQRHLERAESILAQAPGGPSRRDAERLRSTALQVLAALEARPGTDSDTPDI